MDGQTPAPSEMMKPCCTYIGIVHQLELVRFVDFVHGIVSPAGVTSFSRGQRDSFLEWPRVVMFDSPSFVVSHQMLFTPKKVNPTFTGGIMSGL